MKKILTLLLSTSCVALLSCAQQQTIFIPASDTAFHYYGRFDFSNQAKPVFMYSGCMISAGFMGTSS